MTKINLCIDTGNTSIKVAVFEDKEIKEKVIFDDYENLISWIGIKTYSNIIISSVKGDEHEFTTSLNNHHVTIFNHKMSLPIVNKYKTPETLGKDRLASVIGAKSIYPDKNCLIIDAGTCITYDILIANGEYLGGAISPGLNMRYRALNHFTAKLPLLQTDLDANFIGNDTHSCITAGIQNGIVFEVEKTIEEYQKLYPELHVILCGGDSSFFESKIKGTIFAFPDLVLIGLNHSLLYNAPK